MEKHKLPSGSNLDKQMRGTLEHVSGRLGEVSQLHEQYISGEVPFKRCIFSADNAKWDTKKELEENK